MMRKLKWALVMCIMLISLHGCIGETERGIHLAIRNFTQHEYALNVVLHDQVGYSLLDLSIPIEHAEGNTSFSYDHQIDGQFESLLVKIRLEEVPSGKVLDQKIGFWPGKAGTAEGGSSNRIVIEIGIVEQEGQVKANFMGLI